MTGGRSGQRRRHDPEPVLGDGILQPQEVEATEKAVAAGDERLG